MEYVGDGVADPVAFHFNAISRGKIFLYINIYRNALRNSGKPYLRGMKTQRIPPQSQRIEDKYSDE
jgi:hypothetical protein